MKQSTIPVFHFHFSSTKIAYQPSPTLFQFHQDSSLVRGVMGPIGSGKTTACCFELLKRIAEHPIHPVKKVREVVVVIIRNTYQELKDTTLRTWLNLFPEEHFGRFYHSTMVHKILLPGIQADILFRALDKPEDLRKMLSLEATWIYVNEAREVPFSIIQMLPRRLRFPQKNTYGDYPKGVIMDSNPPNIEHWWYKTFEDKKPAGWKVFKQPSGIAPNAENLHNLPAGYYTKQMADLPPEWLRVYRDGKYGWLKNENIVYPEFNDLEHCTEFTPQKIFRSVIGLDFGRTPAAVFAQVDANGNWWIFDEIVTQNKGASEFAEILNRHIKICYPTFIFEIYGDPAGGQKSQTDSLSVYEALAAGGIIARPAPTNKSFLRRESLRHLLRCFHHEKPQFHLHPKCKVLRKAFNGGFQYQKSSEQVLKNEYSHPIEALEYAIISVEQAFDLYKKADQNRTEHYGNLPKSLSIKIEES